MERSFEQAGRIGTELVDGGLRSLAAFSNGMQTIAAEAADYSKRSFEGGSNALEEMLTAKAPEKALQIQAEFARNAYEGFVGHAARMGELYADLAKDIYKPLESVVARPK
jgi:hypothetical protein